MERETGVQVRYYGDLYHTLVGPVSRFDVAEVRLLKLEDTSLLSAHWGGYGAVGFATVEDLLTDGAAAGAVVEGKLVALAHTNAMTARYGDIGVATRRGLAWTGLRLRVYVPRSAPDPGAGPDPGVERG